MSSPTADEGHHELVSTPLVSVIMIFKDAAPYLLEAAHSVLDQTWPALELLLVDDGGTDGSVQLAEGLRAALPHRVRLVSHERRVNRGTGPSRLLGIDEARGAFIAFLDADDVWGTGHVAHDLKLLLDHPEADLVCGRSRVWRSWSADGRDELNPLPFAPGTVIHPPALLRAVLRNGIIAVPTCSLLVRSRLLKAVSHDLSAFSSTYEDQVINTLLHLRAAAVISGATDAWYRQHPNSLTAVAKRTKQDADLGPSPDRRRFVTWVASLPELAPGRADPELRALVDAEMAGQLSPGRFRELRDVGTRARQLLPAEARGALRTLVRGRQSLRRRLRREIRTLTSSWAEDLRGRVAVVGDLTGLPFSPRVTVLHELRPETWRRELAVLRPVDCIVVAGSLIPGDLVAAGQHLLPGGALLAAGETTSSADAVRRSLGDVVGEECVHIRELAPFRRNGQRLLTVRALRPA